MCSASSPLTFMQNSGIWDCSTAAHRAYPAAFAANTIEVYGTVDYYNEGYHDHQQCRFFRK